MSESPLDEVDIPVRFSLGSVSLPLGDLASMQPGYVFVLDAPLDKPVAIEVNGTVIGRGELVSVDGQLGVRLKEHLRNGIESS